MPYCPFPILVPCFSSTFLNSFSCTMKTTLHRKSDPAGQPRMRISKFHCGLVIDAVIILALGEEMELIDAFIMHVFAIDKFWKLAVAHERLVMDAVTSWHIGDICCYNTDFGKKSQFNTCICNTCVCYWYILKACRIAWQIGDECSDYTNNGTRNG